VLATVKQALEDFRREGYAIIPRGCGGDDVNALRKACAALLHGGSQESYPQDVLASDELTALMFDDTVVRFLHALLGDPYVLYPNMAVRRNFFTGWHVDQAFSGPGRECVWEPDYCHTSVNVYLQENTEEAGGGIDVVPGSHLMSFDGFGQVRPQVCRALALPGFADRIVRAEPAPGDVLIKHARLLHGSTVPADEAAARARDKYGFSFSAGRLDAFENNRFITHLATKRVYLRPDGEEVRHDRHTQAMALSYPRDFPETFRERADRAGATVRTFDTC
jgi:ectoine hydroxylase-related dioxygenase (phytanoyl-CoA dioxygenase family)